MQRNQPNPWPVQQCVSSGEGAGGSDASRGCGGLEGALMTGSLLSAKALPLPLLLACFLPTSPALCAQSPLIFPSVPSPFPFLFSSSLFSFPPFYSLLLEPVSPCPQDDLSETHSCLGAPPRLTARCPHSSGSLRAPLICCCLSSRIPPPCTSPWGIPTASHCPRTPLCSCKTEVLCTLIRVPRMPFHTSPPSSVLSFCPPRRHHHLP